MLFLIVGKEVCKIKRLDRDGTHRGQMETNRQRIYASQSVCGICGKPVDKTLKFPHPMSKTIDHIIPINKGGHPSDLDNLQLAHLCCNRQKSDKININITTNTGQEIITNRLLPHSLDWSRYKA